MSQQCLCGPDVKPSSGDLRCDVVFMHRNEAGSQSILRLYMIQREASMID